MSELIHQFGIDWRLVAAQAVNFGILFFVLWRFAYRPVLSVMQARREKISEGLKMRDEAEQKLASADREKEVILQNAERESMARIAFAEAAGKKKEDIMVADALKKSEALVFEGKRRAEEEKSIASEEFSKEAVEIVRAAVAKVIERAPERIDEDLVRGALREIERVKA